MTAVLASALTFAACSQRQRVEGFPDEFSGVGIEITEANDSIRVVKVVPGSPAAEAGVLPGDAILSVDGKSTEGMTLGEVVVRLRGTTQSQVVLRIDRAGQNQTAVVSRRRIRKVGEDYVPTE